MKRDFNNVDATRRSVLRMGAMSGLVSAGLFGLSVQNAFAENSAIYTSSLNNEAVSGYDPVAFSPKENLLKASDSFVSSTKVRTGFSQARKI